MLDGQCLTDGFSRHGVSFVPARQLVVPGATWQVEVVEGQRWYTVRPGDTLSSIAASTLGDPRRWSEVFELNRGATISDGLHALVDANTIWPGLRLRLPDERSEAEQAPDTAADAQRTFSTRAAHGVGRSCGRRPALRRRARYSAASGYVGPASG